MSDRFSRDPVRSSGSYQGMSRSSAGVQAFMSQVYGWMASGLFLTAVVSYYVSSSMTILRLLYSMPFGFMGLFGVQLLLVVFLSARVCKMSSGLATGLFLVYSALTGITLSPIFIVYTHSSIASIFAITAGMFGAVSISGYTTKKDLTAWGSRLFMLLFGLIIATLVNVFWLQNSGMELLLSYAGVLIFVGLTIYDTNRLRRLGEELEGNEEAIRRYAVTGALSLYLDFINMFLYLLRIFGNRR